MASTNPLRGLQDFFVGLYRDPRIPKWDRGVVIVMILLVFSPVDAIPDWIPFVGVFDDLFLISLMGDYFFRILDPEIVLGRWPFGMKSYQSVRRFTAMLASPVPRWVKQLVWRYRPSPYRPS